MKKAALDKSILELELTDKVSKLLISNSIITIRDLWIQTKSALKKMELDDSEIKDLSIKLQLLGLDFGKKSYGKD